jgi:lipopolysaccharide biosynthesis regulator YciM
MFLKTGSLLPLLRMGRHDLGGGAQWLWGWALERAASVNADATAIKKIETAASAKTELAVNYKCNVCYSVEQDYFPQCPACGAWNTVTSFLP